MVKKFLRTSRDWNNRYNVPTGMQTKMRIASVVIVLLMISLLSPNSWSNDLEYDKRKMIMPPDAANAVGTWLTHDPLAIREYQAIVRSGERSVSEWWLNPIKIVGDVIVGSIPVGVPSAWIAREMEMFPSKYGKRAALTCVSSVIFGECMRRYAEDRILERTTARAKYENFIDGLQKKISSEVDQTAGIEEGRIKLLIRAYFSNRDGSRDQSED